MILPTVFNSFKAIQAGSLSAGLLENKRLTSPSNAPVTDLIFSSFTSSKNLFKMFLNRNDALTF